LPSANDHRVGAPSGRRRRAVGVHWKAPGAREADAVSGVQLVPAAQAPLLARPYYAGGDPGAIVAALAPVPEVLEVAMPFIGTVLGPSSLDARTKEIVILRTSARLGCRFCLQTPTVAARDAGLSPGEGGARRGEA